MSCNVANQINMLCVLFSFTFYNFSTCTVTTSVCLSFLSLAMNNRYLPSVLTQIDVLSVPKHKCDCWLFHTSGTIAKFIAVRYLLWRLSDWFIASACEARGCFYRNNIAIKTRFFYILDEKNGNWRLFRFLCLLTNRKKKQSTKCKQRFSSEFWNVK